MRRARAAGLPALAALLLVASGRAQVQQEPFLETTEGTGINITCSHPRKQIEDYIHFYRQLPGRAPEFLALAARGTKDVPAIAGTLSVSEDRRSSALWLAVPRRGDAAVYYCALGTRAEEPGLRPGTNRRGRGRAGPAGAAPLPADAARRGTDRAAPGTRATPNGNHHGPRTRPGLLPETPPSTRMLPCKAYETILLERNISAAVEALREGISEPMGSQRKAQETLALDSGRAQVEQEPFLETTEGTGINITCSHSSKRMGEPIHFYRQLPGRAPEFLALAARGSKDVAGIAGTLSVSEDGRSSALWLAVPRRGDAAVYYCALGATGTDLKD
ncbi:LOW QUALITY PROTEIN: uncharacterized protein LOC119711996 [Motacilla alba alba]|uniref:LOW QUALITY PROTEIN: uncharacterized protein LOC119711996 n=1 Tax=Motacilla alba alba TaxID=1094192 RepID=UPI0018D51370|nr:LOW QUALITY PROTEIN: uncharacterized protein LOC119711996 [Motacilla alba alba]